MVKKKPARRNPGGLIYGGEKRSRTYGAAMASDLQSDLAPYEYISPIAYFIFIFKRLNQIENIDFTFHPDVEQFLVSSSLTNGLRVQDEITRG